MKKEEVLNQFQGNYFSFYQKYLPNLKKIGGDEYQALCPFHKDSNPSFNFNNQNGRYYCHGCSKKGDAIHFYGKLNGLDTRRDFGKILKGIATDFGIPWEQVKKKTIARYVYTDDKGQPLHRTCRTEPKGFYQQHYDNGHWKSGLKGITPVLYQLPQIITANEVLVVEGEKDCDKLAKTGFIATTCPMGAKKWRDHYNESLRGKDIVLIPDNDNEGREHMVKVAASLNGHSKSLKFLELPGLPSKGDASDFISQFNSLDEAAERLSIIIDNTAPYEPELKQADEAECYLEPLTDTDADSSDKYEWIIEKLVPLGEPMIIGGKGSSGKTTLALEFTIQILENDPSAAVVYICAEGTYRDTKIRARQMALTKFNRFFFLKRKGGTTSFKLSEKTDLNLVKKTLLKSKSEGLKILFVVIDSIRGMQKGSLNDDLVGQVMQGVNDIICNEIGATVCYVHHSKKNIQDITAMDALLGSVTIVNSVRHALFLRKLSNRVREIEVCKSNLAHEDNVFRAELNDDKRIEFEDLGIDGSVSDQIDQKQLDKAEEIILSMLGTGDRVPAFKIYERGENAGISVETMKRAKKLHQIDVKKVGKVWKWRLLEGGDLLDPLDTLEAKHSKSHEKEEGQEGGQAHMF